MGTFSIGAIMRKSGAFVLWAVAGLCVVAGLSLVAASKAQAAFCSTTSCTLSLTDSNFIGTGSFGTITLTLVGSTVTVDISLNGSLRIITTGFPGAVGFADSVPGLVTIGNFSSSLYSGSISHATNDLHWDGFGFSNDAAATSGPSRADSLQQLSFDVTGATSTITDVHQLLNLFNPAGGEGPAYFVVDACLWNGTACTGTGLLAVSNIPEPASLALLGTSLIFAYGIRRRRKAGLTAPARSPLVPCPPQPCHD